MACHSSGAHQPTSPREAGACRLGEAGYRQPRGGRLQPGQMQVTVNTEGRQEEDGEDNRQKENEV